MQKYLICTWQDKDEHDDYVYVHGLFKIGKIIETMIPPNEKNVILGGMDNGDLGWKWAREEYPDSANFLPIVSGDTESELILEFLDDKAAILFFKLEYGG